MLFNKSGTTLIQCPCGKSGAISIPTSVTCIGDGAFDSCTGLTSITIPSGVTTIGDSAFSDCTLLTGVTIPAGVTNIGDGVFFYCTSLTSITIPSGVTNIGDNAFFNCTLLTGVTIPAGVTSIGYDSFYGCGLTSLTIPSSVTIIGDSAFSFCTGLTSAYFLGNAPTMDSSVFAGTASGFKVYYYGSSNSGFTTPTWNGYTAVNLGNSPVVTWLTLNGFNTNTNLLSTPNNDGVSLLMDYALNLNPTKDQAPNLPKAVLTGGNLNYTFYAGNTDVSYQVEASTDLKTWSSAGVTVSAPDGNGNCTATVPRSSAPVFLRLVVTH